ncbi:ABC-type Fe3+-hydroxamate transport system substrate-binding protein [Mucilaginibacter frigoritolerans]|uniref:ABC-type Fe3+-hydroxamate transport system substrate-binding protein n=1 Tax=Mucilaginibacter frigoritolerans TaxID=652788 RepID=A0A562U6W0_9SPHI|nr:helical backbone metal receptor [Mucilaginibacter frigoritolerans]TWJ00911.1 ABC-type Fe3+-hydroxamate transport system substrate-binding protein [Mucilaginibacter frigoritolerans]
MPIFHDQLNREISLASVPKRIISVVPSQTELLFYLGLNEEIIGITKFCIHPQDKFKSTIKIGGTKQLDIAKIKSLQPDLIIANKEENERSQVEGLMDICPVWISDISNLAGSLNMIERVGVLVGKAAEAKILKDDIEQGFNKLTLKPCLSTAYFIWRKPYMVAGQNTFIDDMLQKCSLMNVFKADRYPEINVDMLISADPKVVLLSSEPYPFKEKHIEELKAILPDAIIKLVDGEIFSWYGSRLLHAPAYFEWLNKELNN